MTWRAMTMAAAVATAACSGGDDDPAGPRSLPPPEVVGTYTLRSVDGVDLPVFWSQQGSVTTELVAGSLRLNADGSCVEVTQWRLTDGARDPVTASSSTACTFAVSGTVLTLTFVTGTRHTATLVNGAFSYVAGGRLGTYQRDAGG